MLVPNQATLKPAKLLEMVVEGCDSFDTQSSHHNERNGIAKRIGLVAVMSKQTNRSLMISICNLCEVHQRVLPKIGDDLFPYGSRPGKCRVNFGKDESRTDELCALPEERGDTLARLHMVGLAGIAKCDPEGRINKDPMAVHAFSSVSIGISLAWIGMVSQQPPVRSH